MCKSRRARDEEICRSKVNFLTRKIARTQAEKASARHNKKLGYYKCRVCRKYHLFRKDKPIEEIQNQDAPE